MSSVGKATEIMSTYQVPAGKKPSNEWMRSLAAEMNLSEVVEHTNDDTMIVSVKYDVHDLFLQTAFIQKQSKEDEDPLWTIRWSYMRRLHRHTGARSNKNIS